MRKQIALTLLLPLAALLPGCAEPDDVGGHLRADGIPGPSCETHAEDNPFSTLCEVECDFDELSPSPEGCEAVVHIEPFGGGPAVPTVTAVSFSAEGACFDELEASPSVQYLPGAVLHPAPGTLSATSAPTEYACDISGGWVAVASSEDPAGCSSSDCPEDAQP